MKKYGIITSGGDCGGLNAVIKGAARMANSLDIEILVIPNGYAGLYNLIDFPKLTPLSTNRLDAFSAQSAGSEAGHSRVKIKKIADPEKWNRIKAGLKKHDLAGLIISGGDDSGSVILDLAQQGISCVHAPKTMDLDLQTYSVGADSTINRIATFAEDLKTTGRTHNRVIVLEVFGRYAGHTAFRGGVAADADAILIPEIPTDFSILYQHAKERLMRRISESDVHAGLYLIVVAEGLRDASGKEIIDESAGVDAFGHKKLAGAGKFVRQELSSRFKADPAIKTWMQEVHLFIEGINETPEVREVAPGHLVRSGRSSAYDVNFGMEAGGAAVLLLQKNISGVTVAGVEGGKILYLPIKDAIVPRGVNLQQVTLYEQMGICFGREKKAECTFQTEALNKSPLRIY
jgi:6-phosphofructokinase 1